MSPTDRLVLGLVLLIYVVVTWGIWSWFRAQSKIIAQQTSTIHRLAEQVEENTEDITDAQIRMDVARTHLDQLLDERQLAPAPLVAARNELNVTYLHPHVVSGVGRRRAST